jgi:hypothetical protein
MPHLETLKLSKINSWKLWDGKLSSYSAIPNLTSLTIDKCHNIAYIFSSSVARALVTLQYLEISNCQMLEDVFSFDAKLGNHSSAQEPLSNEDVRIVSDSNFGLISLFRSVCCTFNSKGSKFFVACRLYSRT